MARRRAIGQRAQATTDRGERTRLYLSMPQCRPGQTEVVGPALPVASTASEADTAREGDGVAFEIHFDVALTGANADSIAPATQGGIFLGKRSGAVTAGVGIDFARATYSQSSSGVTADTSSTTFLAIPGIRVRIASSQDRHTDLALQGDLGIGVTAFSASDGVQSPRLRAARPTPACTRDALLAQPVVRVRWCSRSPRRLRTTVHGFDHDDAER